MTETLDFESDRALKMLTEALRAGPGSPEWRAAIAELRLVAGKEDEQQVLLRVREHLASGRSYREIHAGPGFTRKVIEQIETEAQSQQSGAAAPSASWIAIISALVIVGVIAGVAYLIWPAGVENAPAVSLERTNFVETVQSATFEDSIGADWQTFGGLTLMADGGLHPAPAAFATPRPVGNAAQDFRGGGLYWDREIPAKQAFSLEASVAITQSSANVIVQVFVTEDRDFDARSGTTPQELVWSLKDGEANVLVPGGAVEGNTVRLKDQKQSVDVRMALNGQDAVVEMNGRQMWAGHHRLDGQKARTIGVRFITRNVEGRSPVSVESVRVMGMRGEVKR
jgi:hypothetical protein